LSDLGFRHRVERQREVGMGMNVDKTGGKHQPGRVDFPRRGFGTSGIER
jgi:hypothetical protein